MATHSVAMSQKMTDEEIKQRDLKWEAAKKKREAYNEAILKKLDRTCQKDSDCHPTPCFGAVNKKWFKNFAESKALTSCFDGCVGGSQTYVCE